MARTVLVGEDDDDARVALSELLTDAGYEVVLAEDGRELKRLIDDGLRPSVILLDLTMPGANGYDFLAWRMSSAQARELPVVIHSGSDFNPVLLRTFSVNAVLEKPTDPRDLLNVLATVVAPGSPR